MYVRYYNEFLERNKNYVVFVFKKFIGENMGFKLKIYIVR